MSTSKIPLQSLETNKKTTIASQTSQHNLKLLQNFKRKLPSALDNKGSIMNSSRKINKKENEDTKKKTNPIKAPSLTMSNSNIVHKYPIVSSKKIKSFTVFRDTPIKTEAVKLEGLPESRISKRGYEKYRNTLAVQENTPQDLFLDDDTPIRRLPYDCLMKIFLLCPHTESLLQFSRVCRSWRKIALQPIVWKQVTCNWTSFNRQLLSLSRTIRSNRQLKYCRHLTITAPINTTLSSSNYVRDTSPFKQMDTLHLSNIRMSDVEYITNWMKHIKVLKCTEIPVDINGSVHIPNLTHLYQLDTLYLQFARPCSLKLTYFISAPDLERLPASLTHLSMTDIYDREESRLSHQEIVDAASYITARTSHWNNALTPDQILDTWIKLEEQLVLKYTMLTFLTNLTSLSLHNVGSFTSKVWRECLIPCSKKLRRVSLKGWSDKRESPQAIVNRIFAYRRSPEDHLKTSDVDRAVSEFFASLWHIEFIALNDFLCTEGVVIGINALNKDYSIHDWPENTTIAQFLDKPLHDFNMTFNNKSVNNA